MITFDNDLQNRVSFFKNSIELHHNLKKFQNAQNNFDIRLENAYSSIEFESDFGGKRFA